MIWLWGGGTRPELEPFAQRFGTEGAVIAAVDLVRGIGVSLGLDILDVDGATGYIKTNFAGKGQAAIAALDDHAFVFVHVEAPDEAGHQGDIRAKVDAIEAIDRHVVGPLHAALESQGDYRILVLPDHPTPIALRTHVPERVPFAYCGTGVGDASGRLYTEANAAGTGRTVDPGHMLMRVFLR
jgi:2,3-bisphosphoglycerate-independent phosphoglycerate mutase